MAEDEVHLATVITARDSAEAAMVVGLLAADGIEATTTGDFTANFLAEAPGNVKVMVRENDLDRATEVLEKLREEHDQPEPEEQGDQEQAASCGCPLCSTNMLVFYLVLILMGLLLPVLLRPYFGG